MHHMKTRFRINSNRIGISILMFLVFQMVFSQLDLNYPEELARMAKIPNSPEAQAFTKYGSTSVSLYTGTPDINVPIYNIGGREMSLPITLSYDATGIKVEQLASQVGLGWNLKIGGRISRIANGFPDDFEYAFPEYKTFWNSVVGNPMLTYIEDNTSFNSKQEIHDYFDFIKKVSRNEYETQPDYFSLNALGINDHIVIDIETKQARALNNPRILVSFVKNSTVNSSAITGWIVTGEDGAKYYFNKAELTEFQGDDYALETGKLTYGLMRKYNSSWVLTKVESPNKKDIFDFEYVDFGLWTQPQISAPTQRITNEINEHFHAPATYPPSATGGSRSQMEYKIKQQFLAVIKHNNDTIISIDLASRADIDVASAITRISIQKPNGSLLKYINFDTSYFGDTASQFRYDKRLKLEGIDILSPNGTAFKSFKFEYHNPEQVPSRRSFAQDYLGYFNGATHNIVLYPTAKGGIDTYLGADRAVSFENAKVGMLKKITYPTGGYTNFEFESHTSPYGAEDEVIEDRYAADFTLVGGKDNAVAAECNSYWCQELYSTPPIVGHKIFTIYEDGEYNLLYESSGQNSFPTYAFLTKRSLPVIDDSSGDQLPCGVEKAGELNLIMDMNTGKPLYESRNAWFGSGSYSGKVYLTKGCYQITMINGSANSFSNFKVHKDIVVVNRQPRAGMRIRSIKNFSTENKLGTSKEYKYITELQGDEPSGEVVFAPIFSYRTSSKVYIKNDVDDQGIKAVNFLNRVSSPSGGNVPHIVYSKVFEFNKSIEINSRKSNGYTEYDFYTDQFGSGVYSTGLPPNANYYMTSYQFGKEKMVTVKDENGEKKQETEYEYIDHLYYLNKGIFLENDWENVFTYPQIISVPNSEKYTYRYIDSKFRYWGPSIPNAPNINIPIAQPCDEPDCINKPEVARNNFRITTAGGRIGNTVRVHKKEFFGDATALSQETIMEYDEDYLLKQTKTLDSKGDEMRTKYYYPNDNLVQGSDLLLQKNREATVVKTEVTKVAANGNEVIIGSKEKEYATFGLAVLPSKIKIKKGKNTTENEYIFSYDPDGNLKESYRIKSQERDGLNADNLVYIWGYASANARKKYLVAKVSGATYTEVSSYTLAIKNASDLDDDRTIGNIGNEGVLRAAINSLRISLPQASVIGYTYDPLIGVTSITDPSGDASYYHYDEFNRLSYISDADNYVLKKYNYNFQGDKLEEHGVLSASLAFSSIALLTNTNVIATAQVIGGSGKFTYLWKVNGQEVSEKSNRLSQLFETTGDKTMTCIVTDFVTGKKSTSKEDIVVYTALNVPVLNTTTYNLTNRAVSFTTSNIGGGSGSRTYEWYINGVKHSATATTFNKTFTAGTHVVKFRVKDSKIGGHYKEKEKTIHVYNSLNTPSLAANKTYIFKGTSINFTTANIGGGSGHRAYEWYINNAKQSNTGTSLNKSFSTTGTYIVKFRVRDTRISGHYKERSKTIYVYNALSTPNVNSPTYNLVNRAVSFSTSGIGGGSGHRTYEWYINGAKRSSTATVFSKAFSTGTYTVKFRVRDIRISGHYKERSKTIYVYNALNTPRLNLPSGNSGGISSNYVAGKSLSFGTTNVGGGSGHRRYEWYVNGVKQSSTSTTFSRTYNKGTHKVKFRVIDTRISSHYKEVQKAIYVHNVPTLTGPNTKTSTSISKGQSVGFEAWGSVGSGSYTYSWYVNSTGTPYNTETNGAFYYAPSRSGYYTIYCKLKDAKTGYTLPLKSRRVYISVRSSSGGSGGTKKTTKKNQ